MLRNNDQWAQKAEQLAQQNERLTVQAAKLTQQNEYLSKANKVQPHIKLCEKAIASAKLLSLWHVTGWLTGRISCTSYGMTESYFYAGRAFLMLAGLHDGCGWLTDSPDLIEDKLRDAVSVARRSPDLLAWNIPNSRRPKAFKSAENGNNFGHR